RLVAPALLVLSLMAMAGLHLNAIGVISLQALASAVALVCSIAATRLFVLPFAHAHPFKLLRSARSFLAADVLASMYGLATIALLGLFAGAIATGIFKPVANIVGLSFVLPSLVFSIALPMLSNPATSPRTYRGLLNL